MKARRTVWLGRMAAASAVVSGVTVTMAQEADQSAIITEVVVTAQRREESLQDVPMSLQVFDQDAITRSGINDIEDIVRLTPGLNVIPTGGLSAGPTNISIRGVSASVGQATAGIYIDDTPIQVRFLGGGQASASAYPSVFDIARVEVLRGPQGTLFGSSSEGGAIRFITPEPSVTAWDGHARSEISSIEGGGLGYQVGLAGGGPLVDDRLGFRASAFVREESGWIDQRPQTANLVPSDSPRPIASKDETNSASVQAVSASLAWRVTDKLTLTPSVIWQKEEKDDLDIFWRDLSDPHEGRFVSGQLMRSPTTDEFTLSSLKGVLELGGVDIYSITSYMDRTRDSERDYSFGITGFLIPPGESALDYPVAPTLSVHENPQQQFTQEVRIQSSGPDDRLSWVVGTFYQEVKQRATQVFPSPGLDELTTALFGVPAVFIFGSDLLPGDIAYSETARSTDTQLAGFGQVDYKIIPKVTLTAGIRYAQTDFDFSNQQVGPLTRGGAGGTGKSSESDWLPKFGVKYEPLDNLMVYATAARGFRPGGANLEAPPICAPGLAQLGLTEVPDFGADYVWSYEAGIKGNSPNSRIVWDAGAFYIDWTDIQRGVSMGCGLSFIDNLGSAVSKGADLQVAAAIGDGLRLGLSVGYTDSYFADTIMRGGAAEPIVEAGQALPTPPWSFVTSIDYSFFPFTGDTEAYVNLENQYSAGYTTATPGIEDSPDSNKYSSSNYTSARIGVRMGAWDISVFARNLLDAAPNLSNPSYNGIARGYTLQPRTLGMTLRAKF